MKSWAIDLSPIKKHRDYRLLFLGQLVSLVGSMISYTAIPYQIYQVTGSTFWVGLTGIVQLIPLVASGFLGGHFADRLDRRKVIIVSEICLALVYLVFAFLAYIDFKSGITLLALSGVAAIFTGFHRPALTALTPKLVAQEDIPAVSSISGFASTIGAVAGPSIGGVLIAYGGLEFTYLIDVATYVFSLICLYRIRARPKLENHSTKGAFDGIQEGLRYALSRPVLWGSYLVDIIAMTFVSPAPITPALSEYFGGPATLGPLYAASSVGAFLASATSAWTHRVFRHGLAIHLAALGWCLAMIAFGFSSNYLVALFFLALAGFSDMVSAIFRTTLWNQTIPDTFRGRLASVEMLSYLFGPLLGSTLMGFTASVIGPHRAVQAGGTTGAVLLVICLFALKTFVRYRAPASTPQTSPS